jgi:hypothetical protein
MQENGCGLLIRYHFHIRRQHAGTKDRTGNRGFLHRENIRLQNTAGGLHVDDERDGQPDEYEWLNDSEAAAKRVGDRHDPDG